MFTEAQKRIFGPFDDGSGRLAYADPARVRRRLSQLLPGETAKHLLEQWHAPAPEYALPAAERFLAAVRDAFEMTPFDPATGEGATEDAVRQVWDAFQAWQVKKNGSGPPPPTGSPSTATHPGSPTLTTPKSGST